MDLARPTTRLALLGVAAVLVAAGLALWIERLRADGALRFWPLVLVIVGTAKAGVGPWDQREEGLWLIATGVWLLVETLAPAVIRGLGPLAIVAAALVGFRWGRLWSRGEAPGVASSISAREKAHVN